LLQKTFVLYLIRLHVQLKELNHDNIKSFIGACIEPGHICYVMQICSRGTVEVSAIRINCLHSEIYMQYLFCYLKV